MNHVWNEHTDLIPVVFSPFPTVNPYNNAWPHLHSYHNTGLSTIITDIEHTCTTQRRRLSWHTLAAIDGASDCEQCVCVYVRPVTASSSLPAEPRGACLSSRPWGGTAAIWPAWAGWPRAPTLPTSTKNPSTSETCRWPRFLCFGRVLPVMSSVHH